MTPIARAEPPKKNRSLSQRQTPSTGCTKEVSETAKTIHEFYAKYPELVCCECNVIHKQVTITSKQLTLPCLLAYSMRGGGKTRPSNLAIRLSICRPKAAKNGSWLNLAIRIISAILFILVGASVAAVFSGKDCYINNLSFWSLISPIDSIDNESTPVMGLRLKKCELNKLNLHQMLLLIKNI
uniref:Transmembrane protein n=1 Tax=Romanomermis culicivorax TaxID=13658 RepID=A0A915IM26_ROMCU